MTVFEKQPLRAPRFLVLMIIAVFALLFVRHAKQAWTIAGDYYALQGLNDSRPQAEARLTEPLMLIMPKPVNKTAPLRVGFRYSYAPGEDKASVLSDRLEIGGRSDDPDYALAPDDTRLPDFIKKHCGKAEKADEQDAVLYTYKTCRPFKVTYHPKWTSYSYVFKPLDEDALRVKIVTALKDILFTIGSDALVIGIGWMYLARKRRSPLNSSSF